MKQIEAIHLTIHQTQALNELQRVLLSQFEIVNLVLFGSVARGEADEESDIDILVLTARPFTRFERHKITDRTFEINLRYNTNFSTMVIDNESWERGIISVLPLHDFILNEGIRL